MQRMFIWVQISRRTQSNCTRARNYVYSVSLNSWMMGQLELLIGACATIGRGRGGHRWADRIMANEGTDVNARRSKEKKRDRKHPHIKSTPVFQILPTAFHSTKQQLSKGRIHINCPALNICIYRERQDATLLYWLNWKKARAPSIFHGIMAERGGCLYITFTITEFMAFL